MKPALRCLLFAAALAWPAAACVTIDRTAGSVPGGSDTSSSVPPGGDAGADGGGTTPAGDTTVTSDGGPSADGTAPGPADATIDGGGPGPSDATGDDGGSGPADATSDAIGDATSDAIGDATPDTGPDVSPPPVEPQVVVVDGDHHARVGEPLEIATSVELHGEDVAPGDVVVTMEVEPAEMAAHFDDHGDGTGTFQVDDVGVDFATTEVTVTVTATAKGKTYTDTVTFRVLGNLWVANRDASVVDVYRSDGQFLVQGIPSTYLSKPTSLLQLGPDRIAVGNRYNSGTKNSVEVFDLDGERLTSFDDKDDKERGLWSIYGGYAMMRHQPSGNIWVGGPTAGMLVFDDRGHFLDEVLLPYFYSNWNVGLLLQKSNGEIVVDDDDSGSQWDLLLLDSAGDELGDFGKNPDLPLVVEVGAYLPDTGRFVFGGKSYYGSVSGYLALTKGAGQLLAHTAAMEGIIPRHGLIAFDDGFLVAVADGRVMRFGGDLELLDEDYLGLGDEASGGAMMILGGN